LLSEDGAALDRPRLVVPGDAHAARGVMTLSPSRSNDRSRFHRGIGCRAPVPFYEAVLGPIGLVKLVEFAPARVGFGKKYPEFWLNLRRACPRNRKQLAFTFACAPPRKTRSGNFHAAALSQWWRDSWRSGSAAGGVHNLFRGLHFRSRWQTRSKRSISRKNLAKPLAPQAWRSFPDVRLAAPCAPVLMAADHREPRHAEDPFISTITRSQRILWLLEEWDAIRDRVLSAHLQPIPWRRPELKQHLHFRSASRLCWRTHGQRSSPSRAPRSKPDRHLCNGRFKAGARHQRYWQYVEWIPLRRGIGDAAPLAALYTECLARAPRR